MKQPLVAVICLSLTGLVENVRAETVSFPKDNPAIALELPAGSKANFDEGSLIIKFKTGFSYARLTQIRTCPRNNEAAKLTGDRAWDDFTMIGYQTSRYVSKRKNWQTKSSLSKPLSAACFQGTRIRRREAFSAATVLWVKEKRCFLLTSTYDMPATKDYLALKKL